MSKTQKKKTKSRPSKTDCTCLEVASLEAETVCIAASFNDWHPEVTPMISLGEGRWVKDLALPPGSYEYRLVVDGKWVDDPSAEQKVPNAFGGFNAVLVVPRSNS